MISYRRRDYLSERTAIANAEARIFSQTPKGSMPAITPLSTKKLPTPYGRLGILSP